MDKLFDKINEQIIKRAKVVNSLGFENGKLGFCIYFCYGQDIFFEFL